MADTPSPHPSLTSGPPLSRPPGPVGSPVYVTDINMSCGSMVVFMVKWAIAAIPAFIILFSIAVVAAVFIQGLMLAGF